MVGIEVGASDLQIKGGKRIFGAPEAIEATGKNKKKAHEFQRIIEQYKEGAEIQIPPREARNSFFTEVCLAG